MPARRDRIAEFLEGWRGEHPGEPFIPQLDRVSGDLADELKSEPLREVHSWLAECERKKAALEREFPRLKRVYQPFSERQEDWEYSACETFIPLLRLEIVRRGQRTESDLGREAIRSPEAEQQGSKVTSGVGGSGNWFDSDPDTVRRRQIVLKNPKMPSESLCNVFDGATPPIPFPRDWRAELGVKTWREAYANRDSRNRVQKIISTDKRAGKRSGSS